MLLNKIDVNKLKLKLLNINQGSITLYKIKKLDILQTFTILELVGIFEKILAILFTTFYT